jgi:uncharacterized protein (TIGR02246 family)
MKPTGHGCRVILVLVLIVLSVATSVAQQTDEAVIRAQIERLVERFNARDARGVAMLYEPDADRRDGSGNWARGRSAVHQMYDRTLRDLPNGVTAHFDFTISLVTPDVALVNGNWIPTERRHGPF